MALKHTLTWKSLATGLLAVTLSSSGYAAHSTVHDDDVNRLDDPPPEIEVKEEILPASQGPEATSPLPDEFRMTSRYGWRRGRRTGRRTFHAGLDFGAPRGTPVQAVRGGTVEIVTRDRERHNGMAGYGNAVVIYFKDEDLWIMYAHLNEVTVKPGVHVEAGQVIGTVGNTSNRRFRGMASHLHFEVRERTSNGEAPLPGPYRVNNQDPLAWLAGHGVIYGERGVLVTPAPETEQMAQEVHSGETVVCDASHLPSSAARSE